MLQSVARDLGFRVRLGPLDVSYVIRVGERSVDERLAKLDVARESLSEALLALDDLDRQAENQKAEITALLDAAETANENRQIATSDLETVRALASADGEALRRVLGMPTAMQRWIGRALSFFAGVAASLLASYLFTLWL